MSVSCIIWNQQWENSLLNYKHSCKLNYYVMFICQRPALNYSMFYFDYDYKTVSYALKKGMLLFSKSVLKIEAVGDCR